MPAETFPPIADPLSLPPAEFVAEAKRRGIGFLHCIWWDHEDQCGCAAGVAAVLADPALAKQRISAIQIESALRVPSKFHRGAATGFDGVARNHEIGRIPSYDHGYAWGAAVNMAAFPDRHPLASEESSHARD